MFNKKNRRADPISTGFMCMHDKVNYVFKVDFRGNLFTILFKHILHNWI